MSTIKSDNSDLTINASGSTSDIKFQANGVEKASISSAGAFTSTTIDATKLTGALPAISGAALTGITTGKVLQVVQDVLDTELAVTLNTTWTSVSGLSQVITPSATSSKILIQVSINVGGQNGIDQSYPKIRLKRDSTTIGIGTGSGSRALSSAMWAPGNVTTNSTGTLTVTFLDEPSTTSTITYGVSVFGSQNRTFYINRCGADESTAGGRAISTITLTEVSV
jgi:hypothetical protein